MKRPSLSWRLGCSQWPILVRMALAMVLGGLAPAALFADPLLPEEALDEMEPSDEVAPGESLVLEAIPVPEGADPALVAEFAAYHDAVKRYVEEISTYQRDINQIVMTEYRRKLRGIEELYGGQIATLRRDERRLRGEAIERLERFLDKYRDNERYAPGVLYRLAVLHYEKAEETYLAADPATLVDDYPDFRPTIAYGMELIERFPDFPQRDGAHYLVGFTLNQMERRDEARAQFLALAEDFPESPRSAEALTRIGEYHFARSQEALQGLREGVEWDQARHFYQAAVEKGPEYAIYDRALYRLAWTEYYIEAYDAMIKRFIELVDYADKVPQGSALRQEAIEFMAAALAEENWDLRGGATRDPEFGMQRFDRYLNENRGFEIDVLRVYADTLMEQSRYDFAAEAYEALLERDNCNPDNPKLIQSYVAALNLAGEQDKAVAVQANLDDTFGRESAWYKCQEEDGNLEAIAYAEMIAQQAMKNSIATYYAEANGFAQQVIDLEERVAMARTAAERAAVQQQLEQIREQQAQRFALTARITGDFLERFPNDQEVYVFRYILAESYYYSNQYELAADAYERVRDVGEGRYRRDAAHGAIDARWALLVRGVEAGADPNGLTPELLKAHVIKHQTPLDEVPDVILAELQASGEIDEAAADAAFAAKAEQARVVKEMDPLAARLVGARDRYVTLELDRLRPEGAPAQAATLRYLNAMVFYHHQNYEEAERRFEEIITLHGDTGAAVISAQLLINIYRSAGDLDKVAALSDRLQALNLGSGTETAVLNATLHDIKYGALFEKARHLFESEKYAEAAAEYERIADENPTFERIHLALYNAGVAYERIKRYESAMRLYRRVYTEYNQTDEAADALFRVGVNGERFFDFDAAVASYLELHDTNRDSFRRHPERVTALRKAALILEFQEEYARAARLFERYHDEHTNQEDAPSRLFAAGVMYERLGDYNGMAKIFDKFRQKYGRDPKLQSLTLLTFVKQADNARERQDNKRAIAFYSRALDAYQASPSAAGEEGVYLAAKAQFMLGDIEFQDWDKIRLEGNNRRAFEQRATEKRAGATRVSTKFNQVLSYNSGEWTMAALYRIGSLYHGFARTLENAQCPPSFDEDTCWGIRDGFLEASLQLKDEAKRYYEAVVSFGRDKGVVNEWTRKSLNGLNDVAPREYPMFEGERVATVSLSFSPMGLQKQPDAPGPDDEAREDEADDERERPRDLVDDEEGEK